MFKQLSKISDKTLGLWKEGDTLSSQVAKSGAITFIGRLVIKLIQFLKTIILARLLFPADFGLFGIAAIAIAFTDTFLQTGFYQALVQERQDAHKLFNTAWTINILRGASMAALTYLLAPLLGGFFQTPEAVPLMRGLALAMLIIGFENVAVVNFQRNFQFSKKFLLDVSIVIGEVVAVIALAWAGFGVWALVFGSVANRIVSVFFSFYYQPYRPSLELSRQALARLVSYGKWVTAGAIITFLLSQGDYLVIGKLLGPESLGYYQLSFALASLPAVEIVRVLGNVLFPLYAKLANNLFSLKQAFVRATRLLLVLPVPAAFGLILLKTEIVPVVYGVNWLPMIPILSVLAIYGLFKSFDAAAQPFFLGSGKPKYLTAVSVWQAVFMFAGILPLTYHFGVVGTAMAVSLGAAAAFGAELWLLRKQINLGFKGLLEIWLAPVAAAMVMSLWLLISQEVSWPAQVPFLAVHILSGSVVYFAALAFYDRWFNNSELWSTFEWLKKNL